MQLFDAHQEPTLQSDKNLLQLHKEKNEEEITLNKFAHIPFAILLFLANCLT